MDRKNMNKTYTGVSICRAGDEYNKLTGEDIAEHKAMAKAYRHIFRQFTKAAKAFKAYADDCDKFADIFDGKEEKQTNCWKKLGGVE